MLIDEDRLRELYAAGEIDLPQLERSLDIINKRRIAAEERQPSERAAEPMPYEQRAQQLDRIMDAPSARPTRRRAGPACPRCGNEAREVVEHGIATAWCATCQAYAGPDPRELTAEQECAQDGYIVGGVTFPLDGGLFG
jgi:hypothetical protein